MRELRIVAREDELVHEDDGVVLGGFAHVRPQHEALQLRQHDGLHRRMMHGKLAEKVGQPRRSLLVGVAQLVDQRGEEATLELGRAREQRIQRANHTLLHVRKRVLCALLHERHEARIKLLELILKMSLQHHSECLLRGEEEEPPPPEAAPAGGSALSGGSDASANAFRVRCGMSRCSSRSESVSHAAMRTSGRGRSARATS